ncbi:MAG: class I SAM-dependent methyltransferase [Desulfobacteraceae bacterium]|nr:class I SAM-dependent methyltransferase [Desulfobacteraceae bacterium]
MKHNFFLLNSNWWRFQWRYWRGNTPWDTNITPPEVMDYLSQAAPGHALDLGCGTGTNAITLAQHGWQVTAIDFTPKAIRKARRKLKGASLKIDFQVGDASNLNHLTRPFNYALDIGCLFCLDISHRINYAKGLKRLILPGGIFMLYVRLVTKDKKDTPILNKQAVTDLFIPEFELSKFESGQDQGSPSAWYWLQKRENGPK